MRKYFAVHIIRIILRVFYIFPVNKKKILFSSYEGGQFSCSPKYIFVDIYDKIPGLIYVWCLNKESLELGKYANIITVKRDTLLWIYHMLTAKVVITNRHLRSFLPYRKNQIIINTWHGGGAYKKVGFTNHVRRSYWSKKMMDKFLDLTSKKITYFISSCKAFSRIMRESHHIQDSAWLPIGMPRNDIFFKDASGVIISLREKLNIPKDCGIVLYAPTHRGMNSVLEKKQ
jgi:CDP-glycerol glycerophosphotransferase